MKHIHAELIKAWADGAKIEIKKDGVWIDASSPSWRFGFEYRIQPTSIKKSFFVYDKHNKKFVEYEKGKKGDLLITFDAVTDKLISAEII